MLLKIVIHKNISFLIFLIIISIFSLIPANGATGDILINNENKILDIGIPWTLQEGYEVTITDLDQLRVIISLSKNGKEIHRKGEYKTYTYEYRNPANVSQLILRFRIVDVNDNKIQLGNIYQYSDGSILSDIPASIPAIIDSPAPTPAPIATNTITLRQWAVNAIASSEYTSTSWSAKQATGAPDTLSYGDIRTAWATLNEDESIQWIELDYSAPVYATDVNVRETFNPGALIRIELKDSTGVYHTVWRGTDPNIGSKKISWSNISFEQTIYPTSTIKLYIDTNLIPGWQEIDAVELVGISAGTTPEPTIATISPSIRANQFSDDFSGSKLSPGWTVINNNDDSDVFLTGTGYLQMKASPKNGGSDYSNRSNYNALRILQPVSGDWIIETRMDFSPTDNYQGAGIMICFEDIPESNTCNRIAERAFYPNEGGSVIKSVGNYKAYTNSVSYFRVMKEGTSYMGWYSSDGVNWILNGKSTKSRTVKYAGLFTVRQPWDGNTDVYSVADYDYFNITELSPNQKPAVTPMVAVTTGPSPTLQPTKTAIKSIETGTPYPAPPHPEPEGGSPVRILALMPMAFLLVQYIKKFNK
ncbi:S-layer protein [uncultured archaeon]|nr:S-layer protein [uncultured archaeon]